MSRSGRGVAATAASPQRTRAPPVCGADARKSPVWRPQSGLGSPEPPSTAKSYGKPASHREIASTAIAWRFGACGLRLVVPTSYVRTARQLAPVAWHGEQVGRLRRLTLAEMQRLPSTSNHGRPTDVPHGIAT
jgi:hypothetical protein